MRQVRPDGMSDIRAVPTSFKLNRFAPAGLSAALRRQKGFNTFVSPWIVAITFAFWVLQSASDIAAGFAILLRTSFALLA